MARRALRSLTLAAAAVPLLAQSKPLRFRSDGTFKVLGISDAHFTRNRACTDISAAQRKYPCSDDNTTAFIRYVVTQEDPDLVVFDGDNVCGGDPKGGADALEGLLVDFADGGVFADIPWAAVEGNHDGESGLNYAQVQAKMLTMHGTINKPNPSYAGAEIYGNTNFIHGVLGPEGSADADNSLLTLYFIDSNSYSTDSELSGGGYGWVHEDQIEWFSNQSAYLRSVEEGKGREAPPALAWQHIPLPEHKTLQDSGAGMIGEHHEPVCSPNINTGMLAAYGETKTVKAVTVGHDHTNDWCSSSPVEGVHLCYDGHTGYGSSGYGRADFPIRARVFHASRFGSLIQTYKHLDPLCGGCAAGAQPITDLQTIHSSGLPLADVAVSITSGSPACPAGYTVVNTDLNKGAGGSYTYLCLQAASNEEGAVVTQVGVAQGKEGAQPICEEGWTQIPGNLKQGTAAAVSQNLCLFKEPYAKGLPLVVGLEVAQGAGAKCAPGYEAASDDISAGVGLPEILCTKYTLGSAEVAARVRVGAGGRLPASFVFSSAPPAK